MNQCRIVCLFALVCLLPAVNAFSQVDVTTNHNDISRTGANLSETILNTSNVNVSNFGKLFTRDVDGEIYAQPLYLSQVSAKGSTQNIVYVATEHNSVYAFDADDPNVSAPLWHVNLGTPVPSQDVCGVRSSGCPYSDLAPEIGITATPVIDRSSTTLYVVAKTKTAGGGQKPSHHFMLHALNAATGAEKFGGPVEIRAPGFDPLYHLNRPGLLLLNGVVYVAFGSVGDINSWHGWVMGYDGSSLRQVAVFNSTPHGNGGSIWAGGQGLAADTDNIYAITANGAFDAPTGSSYGDSVLKLSASRGLSPTDFFTPHNQSLLSGSDIDLGSGGPVLLPGTNLLVGIGKDGVARVINTSNMGRFNALVNNDQQEFTAVTGSCQGISGICFMGAPIYWNGAALGPAIYVWGSGDHLKAYAVNGNTFQTTPASEGSILDPVGLSNTVALSLSANGSQEGTGIVWASAPYSGDANRGVVEGILYAFDASNLSHDLWDSKQNSSRDGAGMYAKFTPPTIANGKVYVPTFSKQLVVYGLTAGDFNLKADPDVLVAAGPSASTTVQVIPQAGGLTTSVSLSCPDLPAGTSCSFTPASLPPQSDTMNSTLTVTVGSASARTSTPWGFWPATWLWLGLCAGVLPLGGWRKKHLCCLFAISGIVAILLAAAGCGGGSTPVSSSSPSPSSPASVLPASKITVLAVSGGIQHKSTVTLSSAQ